MKIISLRHNKIKDEPRITFASRTLLKNAKALNKMSTSQNPPWIKYLTYFCKELGVSRPTRDILRVLERNEKWKEFVKKAIDEDLNYTQYEKLFEEDYEELYDIRTVEHPPRRISTDETKIFFGPIASANILLKDEILRDWLRKKYKAKAVEMESAGVVSACEFEEKNFITIRGICDYCNWRKDDEWQNYAAIAAAAFARTLIESLPSDLKVDPIILRSRDIYLNLIGMILIIFTFAGTAHFLFPGYFLFIIYSGFILFYIYLFKYEYDYRKRYPERKIKEILITILWSLSILIPFLLFYINLFYINQGKIQWFFSISLIFIIISLLLDKYKPFNQMKKLYTLIIVVGILFLINFFIWIRDAMFL